MSQSSDGGKDGGKIPLVQRPLRKYKEDLVSEDEKFARKLQEEEEKRSLQFHSDEMLAHQIANQINGLSTNGDDSEDTSFSHLHDEFARYRGMTEVDSLLAKQMQRQEEETANARAQAKRQQQQLQNVFHLAQGGTPQNEQSSDININGPIPRPPVIDPQRRANRFLGRLGNVGRVHRVQVGMQGRRPGQLQRPYFAMRQHRGAGQLPEGEEDPEVMLMTLGGGMDTDFINIMQEPQLLVMALSRAPQFTGNQQNIDLNDYEGLWELAERLGEVQKKGMSEAELATLPTHSHQSGATAIVAESTDCQVCLTAFVQGETIRTLPCMHEYHKKCVDEWLKRNSSCPICRKDVRQ